MANLMKIRAQLKGDVTAITAIVNHPMETGQRKDGDKVIPAHFIQTLTVEVAGKKVVSGALNTAVSTNPVFNFKVRGVKVGDKVVVAWTDNRGESGTGDTAVVAA